MDSRLATVALVSAGLMALLPAPAQADLIFFATGRVMSVAGHEVGPDTIRIRLRGGGEIVFDRTLVDRIEPDEMPYPDSAAPVVSREAVGRDASESIAGVDAIIETTSTRHGVDPALIRAVIQVESAFRPEARSAKGAMGLMQLMPATARHYAVEDPFNPHENIEAGTRHLKSLLDRFGTTLALAPTTPANPPSPASAESLPTLRRATTCRVFSVCSAPATSVLSWKFADIFRAGHPIWRRCSSLTYSRYSHSSRLASWAPRTGICVTGLPTQDTSRGRGASAASAQTAALWAQSKEQDRRPRRRDRVASDIISFVHMPVMPCLPRPCDAGPLSGPVRWAAAARPIAPMRVTEH